MHETRKPKRGTALDRGAPGLATRAGRFSAAAALARAWQPAGPVRRASARATARPRLVAGRCRLRAGSAGGTWSVGWTRVQASSSSIGPAPETFVLRGRRSSRRPGFGFAFLCHLPRAAAGSPLGPRPAARCGCCITSTPPGCDR